MPRLSPSRADRVRGLLGAALGISLLAARPAWAAEDLPVGTRKPFTGRAVYVSGGAGVVTTNGEPTSNLRVLVTFPVTEWLAIEPQAYAIGTSAITHHGTRESTTGAGFSVGARFAPFPRWALRPYVSTRVAHLHFWPDPWGDHTGLEQGVSGHESHHRFGLGAALGADTALAGPVRVGLEGDALALSGPGVNGFLQGQLTAGFAF
ncbi:MAG TPA: hypothetical protein PLR99_17960 [Polyangiaceae bacterium]|nr:hypothetical protein [Polyangiaceae bacterium]